MDTNILDSIKALVPADQFDPANGKVNTVAILIDAIKELNTRVTALE